MIDTNQSQLRGNITERERKRERERERERERDAQTVEIHTYPGLEETLSQTTFLSHLIWTSKLPHILQVSATLISNLFYATANYRCSSVLIG